MWDALQEDMERRYNSRTGLESPLPAIAYCLAPVVGPIAYLLVRPKLPEDE